MCDSLSRRGVDADVRAVWCQPWPYLTGHEVARLPRVELACALRDRQDSHSEEAAQL